MADSQNTTQGSSSTSDDNIMKWGIRAGDYYTGKAYEAANKVGMDVHPAARFVKIGNVAAVVTVGAHIANDNPEGVAKTSIATGIGIFASPFVSPPVGMLIGIGVDKILNSGQLSPEEVAKYNADTLLPKESAIQQMVSGIKSNPIFTGQNTTSANTGDGQGGYDMCAEIPDQCNKGGTTPQALATDCQDSPRCKLQRHRRCLYSSEG